MRRHVVAIESARRFAGPAYAERLTQAGERDGRLVLARASRPSASTERCRPQIHPLGGAWEITGANLAPIFYGDGKAMQIQQGVTVRCTSKRRVPEDNF